jgi:hypothetical protein
MIPLPNYRKFSEIIATSMKGFAFNKKFVLETIDAPKLNFEELESLFLRTDQEAEEIKAFENTIKEWGPLFLDEKKPVPRVYIASLMRSGNTFFRTLLE